MPDAASRRGSAEALPQRALVAVAHGSADPRAAAAIGELMPLVARRAADRGLSVPDLRVAYLGHAAPSVPQVMRTFGPDTQVTVLPLLLTAAYHSKTDIPRVLARAGTARLNVTYGAPLGPHPLLLRALERRLPEAALAESGRDRRGPRGGRIERPGGERHHRGPGRAVAGRRRLVRGPPGVRVSGQPVARARR